MYVRGPQTQPDLMSDRKMDDIDSQIDINNIWNSHEDRVAVVGKGFYFFFTSFYLFLFYF